MMDDDDKSVIHSVTHNFKSYIYELLDVLLVYQ